jgi:heme exporter protein D
MATFRNSAKPFFFASIFVVDARRRPHLSAGLVAMLVVVVAPIARRAANLELSARAMLVVVVGLVALVIIIVTRRKASLCDEFGRNDRHSKTRASSTSSSRFVDAKRPETKENSFFPPRPRSSFPRLTLASTRGAAKSSSNASRR